jgi:hypothetical protein
MEGLDTGMPGQAGNANMVTEASIATGSGMTATDEKRFKPYGWHAAMGAD